MLQGNPLHQVRFNAAVAEARDEGDHVAVALEGGMELNGGVHDAVTLVEKLVQVMQGGAEDSLLDRYGRQRRGITEEVVQRTTIQNKKNLEAAGDPAKAHAHLLGMSMINSLRRAAEIA